MTRPHIVRADTIDLQDPSSPSAKDHTRKIYTQGPTSPHQANELRHVQMERHAEEAALSSAWHNAHNLSDEPPSLEDEMYIDGQNTDPGPQDELEEEDDDDDDDQLDKISSSPSISDGGFSISPPWPRRTSSLTPVPSPTGPAPARESVSASVSSSGASLNFYHLYKEHLRKPQPELYRLTTSPSDSCIEDDGDGTGSSSPFISTPQHLPPLLESSHHHQWGEYETSENQSRSASRSSIISDDDVFVNRPESIRFAEDATEEAVDDMESITSTTLLEMSRQNMSLSPTSTTSAATNDTLEYEAAGLISDNSSDSSDSSEWETDSDADNDSFDSFTFNDDDAMQFQISVDPLYFASGWSGECLQEVEDIDFEFVYALHNFVATIEGQANAAKNDTMVLLDDSNSYWWLVRVTKDSTIGYLPAEHIETPNERLARLNKHRNIDACQMMIDDAPAVAKSAIKRVMRRRQKHVTFTDPIFREAPPYESYSDEEEEHEEDAEEILNADHQDNGAHNDEHIDEDNDNDESSSNPNDPLLKDSTSSSISQISSDTRENDDEIIGRPSDEFAQRRSKNGTIRNTDSFFKDDTTETRKISLTPKLLSDESSSVTLTESEANIRGSSSFDSDRKYRFKEDKKEKKKGVLSLFKRKKEKKKSELESDSFTKNSLDLSLDPPTDSAATKKINKASNKLQKAASTGSLRTVSSPSGPPPHQSLDRPVELVSAFDSASTSRAESPDKPAPLETTWQKRIRAAGGSNTTPIQAVAPLNIINKSAIQKSHVMETTSRLSESPIQVSAADAEPPALIRDSDSDDVQSLQDTPSPQLPDSLGMQTVAGHSSPDILQNNPQLISGMSPKGPSYATRNTTLQQQNVAPAPLNTTIVAIIPKDRHGSTSTTASANATSTAPSTPVWSDANLRQYLDDTGTADIRDLLILTRDTTGVTPVSNDHPFMFGLYGEERMRVKKMNNTLDGLLGSWIEKRMRSKSLPGAHKMSLVNPG